MMRTVPCEINAGTDFHGNLLLHLFAVLVRHLAAFIIINRLTFSAHLLALLFRSEVRHLFDNILAVLVRLGQHRL